MLTPKERVRRALEHKEADRVPIDYWGTPDVSLKLCKFLNLDCDENIDKWDTYPGEPVDVSPCPESLMRFLNIDLRGVRPPYIGPELKGVRVWGTPFFETFGPKVGSYADSVGIRPLKDAKSIKDLDAYRWPSPDWWNYSVMEEMCERYCDYAIVIGWWSNVFSTCCDLFGMQKFLLNMHMNPELTHAVVERITDFFLEVNRRMFDAVGGKADIFYMWDDIAHQNGLFMKPELWREYFKPSYARLYGLAKKFNLKIMHHICGAIRPLIPELIELGLDILDPVQVRSPGMSPDELKAIYGSKLSFRGAIDVQQTLPFGTADQVREEVRERIRILGEGGGYILASSHTLLMDVPIENILAMYDEANRFRRTE